MRRIYITVYILFTLCFVAMGYFLFSLSYLRLVETVRDFGLSVVYYFCVFFKIPNSIQPTVLNESYVLTWETAFSGKWEEFQAKIDRYFQLLFDGENFNGWFMQTGSVLLKILQIISMLAPYVVIFIFVMKKVYSIPNVKHNRDTVFLKGYKKVERILIHPIRGFISGFLQFIRGNSALWKLWLTIWVLHLNLVSIVVAFFAYYFYFSVTYSVASIYPQFVKLTVDLRVLIKSLTWWGICGIVLYFIGRWRRKIAEARLRHFEARNCGFVNELPIVSITCGSMGKKKTTVITDMILSQEVMFRQKALEILQKADMKFPFFPWICFEDELRACMKYHVVYNLATVKEWIEKKRSRFMRKGDYHRQLYGYQGERYGMEYVDGLQSQTLFDVLETYALAYFIYVIESSLILSNYSVRTDNELLDSGNFPIWLTDFFPEGITKGRHAHILDFDVLRLGKKLVEDNPNIGSFEFGVVGITEIGKERGNNLELKEIKKGAEETNQKNDLFNAWLKMCRHSATVDHFPFIKVFTDEQRPESWGADARDLCEVLQIISSGEQRLALPFYTIEEMISEWVIGKFLPFYTDMRYKRGDNTLLVYLLKGIAAWLFRRDVRIRNKYGYSIVKIEKKRGTLDGKTEKKKYFLMNWKIYARRFTTDCFSDYFNDLASRSNVGLNDYMEYCTEKASVSELQLQNSYFVNGLY